MESLTCVLFVHPDKMISERPMERETFLSTVMKVKCPSRAKQHDPRNVRRSISEWSGGGWGWMETSGNLIHLLSHTNKWKVFSSKFIPHNFCFDHTWHPNLFVSPAPPTATCPCHRQSVCILAGFGLEDGWWPWRPKATVDSRDDRATASGNPSHPLRPGTNERGSEGQWQWLGMAVDVSWDRTKDEIAPKLFIYLGTTYFHAFIGTNRENAQEMVLLR